MPSIVQVIVTQQVAPLPSTLQGTGVLISQGGTILAPGAAQLLTQLSDLALIQTSLSALASVTWSSFTVTATTAIPHGYPLGQQMWITVASEVPTGYDGTFLTTIVGASTFTYPLGTNPGAQTVAGTYVANSAIELQAMANTFFAQGVNLSVYVLELGPGSPDSGISTLGSYLIQNPNASYTSGATGFYYSYLIPRTWDGNPNLINLIAAYSGPTARTYFWITTTLSNYHLYSQANKAAILFIESPTIQAYPANALTGLSWSGGIVTATTTVAHGVLPGTWFQIQGSLPSGYNGYWLALPGTGGATLQYALATNPGAETTLGTLVASQTTNAGVPITEFTLAWPFWASLHYQPGPTNRVTPFSFVFGFGVTPFPQRGFNSVLTTLLAAGVNYAGTGAEGGTSNVILRNGTTADGRVFNYWYSVDWAQINSDLNISNAVIDGSNNPLNPLFYNQLGIDRLQNTVVSTMNQAITFGLATGTVATSALNQADFNQTLIQGKFVGQIVVNAVPFIPYLTSNPGDYRTGRYGGLSVNYITQNGFLSIVFNLNVTDFLVG